MKNFIARNFPKKQQTRVIYSVGREKTLIKDWHVI